MGPLAGSQSCGHEGYPESETGQPGSAIPQHGGKNVSEQPVGYTPACLDARGLSPGADRATDPAIDGSALYRFYLLYTGADGVRVELWSSGVEVLCLKPSIFRVIF